MCYVVLIFINENLSISINISMKFVPKGPIDNIPALVQIMAWRRPGNKPLSEPMMFSLLTHICVTRPQRLNGTQPSAGTILTRHTLNQQWPVAYLHRGSVMWKEALWELLFMCKFRDIGKHLPTSIKVAQVQVMTNYILCLDQIDKEP